MPELGSTTGDFSPKRSLGAQAVVIAVATGIGQIAIGLLYILAARHSPMGEYGITISAIALGLALVGPVDFGTSGLWVREVSSGRLTTGELAHLATWRTAYVAVGAILWGAAAILIAPGYPYWIAGIVALTQSLSLVVQTAMRARGRAEMAGVAILLDRSATVTIFSCVWLLGFSVLTALVTAVVLGPAIGAFVANRQLLRNQRVRVTLGHPANPWKGSGHFGLAAVSASLQSSGDIPVIALFGGPVAAAAYGAVSRWTQPLALLAQAYASAAAPYVAHAPSTRAAVGDLRSAAWLLVMAVMACLVMIAVAPYLVPLILGVEYVESGSVLRLLAAGTVLYIVGLPAFTLLMARGHDRVGALVVASSVLVTFGLIVILTPLYGAVGAGVAYLVGQTVRSLGLLTGAMLLSFGISRKALAQSPSSDGEPTRHRLE